MKISETKKVIFIDLDGTLIETISKKTFPTCIVDSTPIWSTWNSLKKWWESRKDRSYIFIVSNQGGIELGVVGEMFLKKKFEFISSGLQEFIDKKFTGLTVDYIYCPGNNKKDPLRKPNPGMLKEMIEKYSLWGVKKEDMVMIGDASGRPGDFSNSDLEVANNFGIDYIDYRDL